MLLPRCLHMKMRCAPMAHTSHQLRQSLKLFTRLSHAFMLLMMLLPICSIKLQCIPPCSNGIDHIHKCLLEAPDGSPPWKQALAELDSASCRNTFRCGRLENLVSFECHILQTDIASG